MGNGKIRKIYVICGETHLGEKHQVTPHPAAEVENLWIGGTDGYVLESVERQALPQPCSDEPDKVLVRPKPSILMLAVRFVPSRGVIRCHQQTLARLQERCENGGRESG